MTLGRNSRGTRIGGRSTFGVGGNAPSPVRRAAVVTCPSMMASIGGEPVEQRLEHLLGDADLLAVAIERRPVLGQGGDDPRPAPVRLDERIGDVARPAPARPLGPPGGGDLECEPDRRPWRGCYRGAPGGLYDPGATGPARPAHQLE